ncbi:hypothetical protein ACQP1O_42935 (plasmid) [Nocardia sp. CA-151230]
MNTLLLAAAEQGDHVSWPDALVLIALFVLAGFVAWLWLRGA